MPSFPYTGLPPQYLEQQYFEPKYDDHPSLRGGHHASHQPSSSDMDLDPYDHTKYSSVNYGCPCGACHSRAQVGPVATHAAAAPTVPPFNDLQAIQNRGAPSSKDQAAYLDPPAYQEPPPKNEKVTGGVSAQLDYDMECMVKFVVEMSHGIIGPSKYDGTMFRKWVAQVLNATRLPSATVVLSLSYLAIRVRGLSAGGHFAPIDRDLYTMLTVALILGSKFLDDNTFQNKSWAEVSNISVTELNGQERDWLIAFDHRLHHDPTIADGFDTWQQQWNSFQTAATLQALAAKQPASVSRMNNTSPSGYYYQQQQQHHVPTMSSIQLESSRHRSRVAPAYSPAYQSYSPYAGLQPWYHQRSSLDYSPSTATHSGPNTPEYFSGQDGWATLQACRDQGYYDGSLPSFKSGSTWKLPKPVSNSSSIWSSHGQHCQCPTCRRQQAYDCLPQARYGSVMAA